MRQKARLQLSISEKIWALRLDGTLVQFRRFVKYTGLVVDGALQTRIGFSKVRTDSTHPVTNMDVDKAGLFIIADNKLYYSQNSIGDRYKIINHIILNKFYQLKETRGMIILFVNIENATLNQTLNE